MRMAANEQTMAEQAAGDTASQQTNLDRPSAEQIYRQVLRNAEDELKRTAPSLFISGFAGGTFMGLSALGTAIALALLGNGPVAAFCAKLFYPLGFITVILGRAQLFTENTLYPVALVLARKKHVLSTLRLWALVLPGNVLGASAFAALACYTAALKSPILAALVGLGVEASNHPAAAIFWSGVMGGWMIALVAWLVSGSHSITGSVMIIFSLTFVVGLGGFAHCIAGSGEVIAAVMTHRLAWTAYPRWLGLALAGNISGGVLMVTVLEYGQVIGDSDLRNLEEDQQGEYRVHLTSNFTGLPR